MVNVIILEVHTTFSWPARTLYETSEIALNVDHVVGVSASTRLEYPGSCVLLDHSGVLLLAESEEEVQKKMQHPYVVEFDDFLSIEHWENQLEDRIWVSRNRPDDDSGLCPDCQYEDIYATTTAFDLWSRP